MINLTLNLQQCTNYQSYTHKIDNYDILLNSKATDAGINLFIINFLYNILQTLTNPKCLYNITRIFIISLH